MINSNQQPLKLKIGLGLLLTIISACLAFSLNPGVKIQAAEDEDEASPSATKSLKDRIEKVVDEKKDQVEQKVTESTAAKRGFIGRIDRVSEEAITLVNAKGTQVIPLSPELELVKDDQEANIEDLAVDDWVTVLGIQNDKDFEPLRIVISEDQLSPRPQVVAIGSIASFNSSQVTLKSRQDDSEVEFDLNNNTDYKNIEDEDIAIADLFEDMQCLIAGYTSGDEGEVNTNHALLLYSLAPLD